MPDKHHVPMDELWTMPVPVSVSLLLRDGGLAWSCGQLALDRAGNVLAANDLGAQSRIVSDYIETILERARPAALEARRVTLYYVHRSAGELEQMITAVRERLGETVLLDPVPVPYFYYDGILLEADVYAEVDDAAVSTHGVGSAVVSVSYGVEAAWVSLDVGSETIEQGLEMLEDVLAETGLAGEQLVSERWVAMADDAPRLAEALHELNQAAGTSWCADPGGIVLAPEATGALHPRALLTFVTGGESGGVNGGSSGRAMVDDIVVSWRRRGRLLHLAGRSLNETHSLVAQTTQIMRRLERVVVDQGLAIDDLAKVTAYYVGDNEPETLHANMDVRNSYYTDPGPASTGLPVAGFADDRSKIVVELTLTASA